MLVYSSTGEQDARPTLRRTNAKKTAKFQVSPMKQDRLKAEQHTRDQHSMHSMHSDQNIEPGLTTKCPQQILVLILVRIIVSLHPRLDLCRDHRRQRSGRRSRRRWGPTTIKTRIGTRIRCRTENIQRVSRSRQTIPPVISTNPLSHLQGAVEHGAFACLHRDVDHLVAITNRTGAGDL